MAADTLQADGDIRDDRVEVVPCGHDAAHQDLVPSVSPVPAADWRGVFRGVGVESVPEVVQGAAVPQTERLLRLRPGHEVSVGIAEPRKDRALFQVDDPRVTVEPDRCGCPDGRDASPLDQERLRDSQGGVNASIDQRRLFRMGHLNLASLLSRIRREFDVDNRKVGIESSPIIA